MMTIIGAVVFLCGAFATGDIENIQYKGSCYSNAISGVGIMLFYLSIVCWVFYVITHYYKKNKRYLVITILVILLYPLLVALFLTALFFIGFDLHYLFRAYFSSWDVAYWSLLSSFGLSFFWMVYAVVVFGLTTYSLFGKKDKKNNNEL